MRSRKMDQDSLTPADPFDQMDPASPIALHSADLKGYAPADHAVPEEAPSGTGPTVLSVFKGTAAGDTIYGSDLADTIFGLGGADDLHGSAGNDHVYGGSGHDRLYGDEGDDILEGGAGADRLDGGSGVDTVSYHEATGSGVMVNLAGGGIDPDSDAPVGAGFGGDAEGDTYYGIENVRGSMFDDTIIGDAGNNVLDGNHGDDRIIGGAGEDRLIGGMGHDTLTGDGDGSIAADTFVIHGWVNGGDVITDFQQGVDKIDLGIDQGAFGQDGELAWGSFDANGLQAHSLDESDLYFFDTGSDTLYRCHYSNGDLHLMADLVTVDPEIARLQTDDFVFM